MEEKKEKVVLPSDAEKEEINSTQDQKIPVQKTKNSSGHKKNKKRKSPYFVRHPF